MRNLLETALHWVCGFAKTGALATFFVLPTLAEAQLSQPAGMAPAGVAAAQYQPPYSMAGGYMDAYGDPIVRQTGYGAPCGPMGCSAGGPMGGGPMGCGPMGCGPGGCGPGGCGLGGGGGHLANMMGCYGGANGMGSPQAGPHYFDFSAEYLNYDREDSPLGSSSIISTFGFVTPVGGVAPPAAVESQQALNANQVGGGEYDGYRLTGRVDVGALSVFEISYSGLFDDDANVASVMPDIGDVITPGNPSDNARLFSIFSDYGASISGVATGTEFEETDNALEHRVSYESELHSAEATYRRYWFGFNPRVSGTLLVGFRYTNLQETFSFFSQSDLGSINIGLESDNRLAGVQTGGDAWFMILPGLRVGAEAKVGLYNNNYDVSVAASGTPNLTSTQSGNQAAFLTEAKFTAVANLTSSLSARGGYELLYMSDLAMVGDNLLANPLDGSGGVINANGDAYWNGWHAGIEFVW